MLKLEATLIATTRARPWRSGWSLDSGVDFTVPAPVRQAAAAPPPDTEWCVAGEPASFLDDREQLPAGTVIVQRHISLAAQTALEVRNLPEPSLTRAWSSVARKVPGS